MGGGRQKIAVAPAVAAICLSSIATAQDGPCTEAEILALEHSESFTPPANLLAAITADILAIGEFDGFFVGFRVLPSWIPSTLLVRLTPAAMQAYLTGTYQGFDGPNALYGPVTMRAIPSVDVVVIDFEPCYNPLQLAQSYLAAPGVIGIEPDTVIGDGGDFTVLELGRYLYTRGWGDCLAGCSYHQSWVIAVLNGDVRILEEYGDALAFQTVTWGALKGAYR